MAANLFHHGVDTVAVFHIVIVWRLVRSKTFAVKQESNRVHLQTSSLAKRLENLLELGGRAHLEVHLTVFLRRVSRQSLYPPWKIFLLSLYNAHIPRVPVSTTSRVNASRKLNTRRFSNPSIHPFARRRRRRRLFFRLRRKKKNKRCLDFMRFNAPRVVARSHAPYPEP